jgi:F-type H+-transporting ATPase subunit c
MRRQNKNITKRRKEMTAEVMKMITVGLIGGIGFFGPALALGLIGYSAMQSLGRNPEARGAIMTNMILIGALAEAIGIYVLIVCIILTMIVK